MYQAQPRMAGQRKERSAQSYPVDPDDLHRRLCIVLKERRQQEALERKAQEAAYGPNHGPSVALYAGTYDAYDSGNQAPARVRHQKARPQSFNIDHLFSHRNGHHQAAPAAVPQISTTLKADGAGNEGLVRRLSRKARDFHRLGRGNGGDSARASIALDEAHQGTNLERRQSQARYLARVDDERHHQQSDGDSSNLTRSTDQRSSTSGRRWRADAAGGAPLDKPKTSDGVLHLHPVPYQVGWTQGNDLAPPKLTPIKKIGGSWHLGHKLAWPKSSRRADKSDKSEKLEPNGQKSPLTNLFSRLRR